MNNASFAGALRAGDLEFGRATPRARGAWRRSWGLICGVTFIAVRSSIYLIVLPFAAVACLMGVALYAIQAAAGGNHG